MRAPIFSLITSLMLVVPASSPALTLSTPHFTVEGEGFSDAYVRRAADSAEESLALIGETLGSIPDSTITVVLAATDARFRELTEGALPDWSAAAAMPGRRIVLTPLKGMKIEMERILAHEIVHTVIDDAAGETFVPRWFHEGCAELLSGEWNLRNELYMSWMVVRGNLLSFEDIQDVFSRGNTDAGLAYDQSMLAAKRLLGLRGEKAIPRVMEGLREGKDFPEAFLEASGYTIPEFEKEYIAFLGDKYGVKMLVTLFPGTWTIAGLMVIVVYLVKRARSKRKLAEWEKGERFRKREPEPVVEPSVDDGEIDDVPDDDAEEIFDEYGEPYDDEPLDDEPPKKVVHFKPRPRRFGGGTRE